MFIGLFNNIIFSPLQFALINHSFFWEYHTSSKCYCRPGWHPFVARTEEMGRGRLESIRSDLFTETGKVIDRFDSRWLVLQQVDIYKKNSNVSKMRCSRFTICFLSLYLSTMPYFMSAHTYIIWCAQRTNLKPMHYASLSVIKWVQNYEAKNISYSI